MASHRLQLLPALCVTLCVASWVVFRSGSFQGQVQPSPPVGPIPTADRKPPAAPPALAGAVRLRPLTVSRTSASHEWTGADATDFKIIEKIAHNPDEIVRLVEENDRIKRRQLVYRKEPVPVLLDRARNRGERLEFFTLPGLDGREVEVEVIETRLNGVHGSVMGRVKGILNSLVSVGFSNGCESFNVSLPEEGLFLTADAREPGEVLVKEIDPGVYFPPTICQPILTQ